MRGCSCPRVPKRSGSLSSRQCRWELTPTRAEYVIEENAESLRSRLRRTSLISMTYRERGTRFVGERAAADALAPTCGNPGAVLMLDEPDAHLEILRRRSTRCCWEQRAERYSSSSRVIRSAAERSGRAGRCRLVRGPAAPDRRQRADAEGAIGFEDYYQAEQTGWILYLEGDLAILDAFAQTLDHKAAMRALVRPFVHYIGNRSPKRAHFHGLREAVADRGFGYDRQEKQLTPEAWTRNEIESCQRETFASTLDDYGPLFQQAE